MSQDGHGERYKWTVLVNTTIGTLMATIDASSSAWSPPRPRGCAAAAAVPAPGTRWPLIWYTTGTQR